MIARLLGAALLIPALGAAQTPIAPKLGADIAPTVATTTDVPAQRIPSVVTICTDPIARRCWTVAGVSDCDGSERVATLPADSAEAGARLRACWAALTRQ